MINIIKDGARP